MILKELRSLILCSATNTHILLLCCPLSWHATKHSFFFIFFFSPMSVSNHNFSDNANGTNGSIGKSGFSTTANNAHQRRNGHLCFYFIISFLNLWLLVWRICLSLKTFRIQLKTSWRVFFIIFFSHSVNFFSSIFSKSIFFSIVSFLIRHPPWLSQGNDFSKMSFVLPSL